MTARATCPRCGEALNYEPDIRETSLLAEVDRLRTELEHAVARCVMADQWTAAIVRLAGFEGHVATDDGIAMGLQAAFVTLRQRAEHAEGELLQLQAGLESDR